ncbi:MAG: hypothetical protein FWE21_10770 [Defluviitaleaceae bacterium]|nr:hypothetical protein [Defluviitaleaceae bacterium]
MDSEFFYTQIEVTVLQFQILIIIRMVLDGIFASLFFHWALKLGAENISRKANWVGSVTFFAAYIAIMFLPMVLQVTFHTGSFWSMLLMGLGAVSTSGMVLLATLTIRFLLKLLIKTPKPQP